MIIAVVVIATVAGRGDVSSIIPPVGVVVPATALKLCVCVGGCYGPIFTYLSLSRPSLVSVCLCFSLLSLLDNSLRPEFDQ